MTHGIEENQINSRPSNLPIKQAPGGLHSGLRACGADRIYMIERIYMIFIRLDW